MRPAKITVRHEAPAKRWNHCVPIRVGLPGDPRRHRRPTGVVFSPMPCDPGRRPFAPWYPAPSARLMEKPAPIMVWSPTPRFIRHPRPSHVRVRPTAVRIRTPARRDIIWRPHPAVGLYPQPLPVRRQRIRSAQSAPPATSCTNRSCVSLPSRDSA